MTILSNDFALLLHLNFIHCSGQQRCQWVASVNRIGLRQEPPSLNLDGLRLDPDEFMSQIWFLLKLAAFRIVEACSMQQGRPF